MIADYDSERLASGLEAGPAGLLRGLPFDAGQSPDFHPIYTKFTIGLNRLSPRGLRGLVTRVRVLFRLRVLLTEKGTDIGI